MAAAKHNQQGHLHLIVPVVVLLVVAAAGSLVYHQTHKPSKITDPTVQSQLKKVSSDLKNTDLAGVKASVQSVQSTQSSFSKKQ